MSKKPILSDSKAIIFDYKQLNEFHPGLVYGFDAESSIEKEEDSLENAMHTFEQYQDVMNAYLYAQNEVLPIVRRIGIKNITSEQLINWIHQIHRLIANALALDQSETAGQYTTGQLLRWHPSHKIQICVAMAQLAYPQQIWESQAKSIGVDPEAIQQFVNLLKTIASDSPGKMIEEGKLFKLYAAVHQNKLTDSQLAIVNKIVTVCAPPDKLPGLMIKFANKLLKKWKTCDKNNSDQIAELAFFAFAELVDIHPYFNGNGRTATCLMNIILCSLDQQSILMRYPGERDQEDSSYNLAIKKINTQPQLLVQHIKTRLGSDSYEDKQLAAVVKVRVELVAHYKQLLPYFPSASLNEYYQKWTASIEFLVEIANGLPLCTSPVLLKQYNELMIELSLPQITSFAGVNEKEIRILFGKYFLKQFKILQQQITATSASPQTIHSGSTVVPSVVQHKYTEPEKKSILSKLASLTGQSDWKAYTEKGATVVLLKLGDDAFANKIIQALQKTESLQAKLMRDPATKEPVIKLSAIQIHKLLAVESLPELSVEQVSVDKITENLEQLAL